MQCVTEYVTISLVHWKRTSSSFWNKAFSIVKDCVYFGTCLSIITLHYDYEGHQKYFLSWLSFWSRDHKNSSANVEVNSKYFIYSHISLSLSILTSLNSSFKSRKWREKKCNSFIYFFKPKNQFCSILSFQKKIETLQNFLLGITITKTN